MFLVKPLILGFVGLAGCGKSTAALHLVEGHSFVRIRFADPIKAMMRALGLSDSQIDGNDKETSTDLLCGQTPRHAMQTLGYEWGRCMIAPGIWTAQFFKSASIAQTAGVDVVADDVRFVDEACLIRSMSGTLIRVFRPGLQAGGHASEKSQANIECDYTVLNNQTETAFKTAISKIAYALCNGLQHDDHPAAD